MKKEKFIYNTQTLRYEKVEVSWRTRLLRAFGFLCAVLVFATFISLIALSYFASPKEKSLKRELQQMSDQYSIIQEQLDLQEKVLENIQDRDANVHRMIFGMDPIDKGVWEGGVGGSNKYNHLLNNRNAGKIMATTMGRLDKLRRQMTVQSKSLDSIAIMIKEKDKMIASIPSIKPVREDRLNRAMSQMSGFGMRIHPIYRIRKMHTGIDFAAKRGTPIYATGDGTIQRVQSSRSGYGNNVVINHGYGYNTLYGHMQKMIVKEGQKVKKGQKIGTVVNTGRSTAPHLHYEVHYKGSPINPVDFCQDNLTPQEYEKFVELASKSNFSFDAY